jgi:hypothetical protein
MSQKSFATSCLGDEEGLLFRRAINGSPKGSFTAHMAFTSDRTARDLRFSHKVCTLKEKITWTLNSAGTPHRSLVHPMNIPEQS